MRLCDYIKQRKDDLSSISDPASVCILLFRVYWTLLSSCTEQLLSDKS